MSKSSVAPLAITGYADKLCVRPGETMKFMVSSKFPRYEVKIVRLIHGDPNKTGPGFKSEDVDSDVEGTYDGRVQTFHHGSCIVVRNDRSSALRKLPSFTLQCWIYPTTVDRKERAIAGQWSEGAGPGYLLLIDNDGELTLRVRGTGGKSGVLKSGRPLKPFTWYFVAASYNHRNSRGTIVQQVVAPCATDSLDSIAHERLGVSTRGENGSPFVIAAVSRNGASVRKCFNGKIDGVKLFSKALSSGEIQSLKGGTVPRKQSQDMVANWDFARETHSSLIKDLSRNRLHGVAVNLPVRAVTGHNWSGDEDDFRRSPKEYNAVHFHDDDQGHAGWKVDFEFTIPKELGTGVYAAHLRAKPSEDYIPFFVVPPKGRATSKIALLIPTLSYMAYSNERTLQTAGSARKMGVAARTYPNQPQDAYIVANKLTSLYDHHSDGSGVCYVSRLRPIVNMRPKYNMPGLSDGNGAPHQFNADLHLVDWMETKGFRYDVLTDENLHHEGENLLSPYNVVVTGSHPEYWTAAMLRYMQSYLNKGGRLMYLGGNGLYWVTSINPEDPRVFEVRRWGGTGTWNARPGEVHNSSTGELGGMWRNRAKAPQKMLGVGFTAQGFDANRPYRRSESSFDKRAAFIFEGIAKDQLIGDFPSLVQNVGAAGFEIDRLDYSLGTPSHALLVATASGFSDSYQHVLEENTMSDNKQGGTQNKLVRSDMVFLPYPRGGAVFSVGSIAWCGCLSYNAYDNSVSRVTQNVLSRFQSDGPLPQL